MWELAILNNTPRVKCHVDMNVMIDFYCQEKHNLNQPCCVTFLSFLQLEIMTNIAGETSIGTILREFQVSCFFQYKLV